ncbi:MAG: mandelate racemase/muconate lactonizing enzyme family protein [Chloroflexi bacterium]|nr:mandelate racemase/muconate lactonizing enzyme family protein [Chloroflexota bacterium]
MKIVEVRSRAVSVPLERPILSAVRRNDRIVLVVVDVLTDAGIVGQTYIQAFGVQQARAVQALIAYLGDGLRDEDPILTLRCFQVMDRAINLLGRGGLATFALSALDCALWDIVGKAYGTPLALLLGAAGDRCAAYQSAGLWLLEPGHRLHEEAAHFAAQGFRGVKMRVGRPNVADDLEAAHQVRGAIGPHQLLLIDANQAWSVDTAITMGRALESVQPFWLEEPVDHDDLDGLAQVAHELSTAIAAGENSYLLAGFRALVEKNACDVLMPDVQRVGGVTGWMRVAALAEAWKLPLSSHLFPEISVHLLAASPTAQLLEYMPWAEPILAEPLVIEAGAVMVPRRPGLGLAFDEAALERYALT